MKKIFKCFLFTILTLFLTGCVISAGTHGSVKGYRYPTKKDNLEKTVMDVIKKNSNIHRDTSLDSLGSSPLLDHGDSPGDYSAGENFYNDIKHYVTIVITSGKSVNTYTFRYYGADEEWNTSESSEIFICYAYDKNGNGGSEGNGGITKKMAGEFTGVFEKEFVDKIDKELHLTHTDTE